jgi:formylglycine-generating enzyme required for sulfatase activity
MTNCGAANESCCTSLEVQGGTYYRTYTNSGTGPTGEADQASVSSFRLDKYDVTVGRFRQFVKAWNGGAGYTPPAGSGKHTHLNGGNGLNATGGGYEPGWVASDNGNIASTSSSLSICNGNGVSATWTDPASSQENLPINCLLWYEAYAFCIWDGGFLPSEAEWEYAAAGGSQQREYPWGATDPGVSYQYANYSCNYPNVGGGCSSGILHFAPVGTATLGAGLWGQLDLVGNVRIWNLDWYAGYVNPCTDCTDLSPGGLSERVVRAGDFGSSAGGLLPTDRSHSAMPSVRLANDGVRCARVP